MYPFSFGIIDSKVSALPPSPLTPWYSTHAYNPPTTMAIFLRFSDEIYPAGAAFPLNLVSIPDPSDFTLTDVNGSVTVEEVLIYDVSTYSYVRLNFFDPGQNPVSILVSYTPGSSPLKDALGQKIAGWTEFPSPQDN